jgi:hypothetical protein
MAGIGACIDYTRTYLCHIEKRADYCVADEALKAEIHNRKREYAILNIRRNSND